MRKEHPQKFFTEDEKQKLTDAIGGAEQMTSGEIRLHLARRCKKEPMEEAKEVFERLGMTQTAERNGILFFISLSDHAFVILGDRGIHEKVGGDFWHSIRDEVLGHFKREQFLEGLIAGIKKCGDQLSQHFPRKLTDQNELPDEISTS
jgi:uncharacterized membrane protein